MKVIFIIYLLSLCGFRVIHDSFQQHYAFDHTNSSKLCETLNQSNLYYVNNLLIGTTKVLVA